MRKRDARPLYAQIDAELRERLIQGTWRAGMMIPSELQFAAEFGVSLGTVRRAIDALVAEGVLHRRQGMGTFVTELTERRSLRLYFNFVRADGKRVLPESRFLERSSGRANATEIAALHLTPRDRVLRFERLRLLEGRPVILEHISVPEACFPGLGEHAPLTNQLFHHYEARYGLSVVRADERLSAVSAGRPEAKLLGVRTGAPLLRVERIAYLLDGRPIELRRRLCETSQHVYVAPRGADVEEKDRG